MSFHETPDPRCSARRGCVALVIRARPRDLGGFEVRRVLPARERRMVGPFVFFDHIGPAEFGPGEGINVRPHPHIGLATVTYLFEGQILHRDSLGYVQPIEPGAVNLMTAGRGIVHSERAGDDLDRPSRLHGIQSWMALPLEHEMTRPAFEHVPAERIPTLQVGGATVSVVIGAACGAQSPVQTLAPTLYLDARLDAGASLELPRDCAELAVYTVSGEIAIEDEACAEGSMTVLRPGSPATLVARAASRVIVIGGEPLGERRIWWNFVASSPELMERAKADWKAGRFPAIPGETDFIPLPE